MGLSVKRDFPSSFSPLFEHSAKVSSKPSCLSLSHKPSFPAFAHLCDDAFIFVMVLFCYDQEDDFIFALEQWFWLSL